MFSEIVFPVICPMKDLKVENVKVYLDKFDKNAIIVLLVRRWLIFLQIKRIRPKYHVKMLIT